MKIQHFVPMLFMLLISTACSPAEDQTAESTGGPGYITPSQQEGPYYPLEKLDDRDNDLLVVGGSSRLAAGEVLSLAGVVYDQSGVPVEGAVVEIWQTDSGGVYFHPNDPGYDARDPDFQSYGEATTGPDGVYSFRTLLPGLYGNRPRHIHVKVILEGEVVLTTQFYFAEEISLTGVEVHLLVTIAPAENDEGNPIWVGERDIVLDLNK
jgi:protocatechuate 3,4-dioxygenase beta subunit